MNNYFIDSDETLEYGEIKIARKSKAFVLLESLPMKKSFQNTKKFREFRYKFLYNMKGHIAKRIMYSHVGLAARYHTLPECMRNAYISALENIKSSSVYSAGKMINLKQFGCDYALYDVLYDNSVELSFFSEFINGVNHSNHLEYNYDRWKQLITEKYKSKTSTIYFINAAFFTQGNINISVRTTTLECCDIVEYTGLSLCSDIYADESAIENILREIASKFLTKKVLRVFSFETSVVCIETSYVDFQGIREEQYNGNYTERNFSFMIDNVNVYVVFKKGILPFGESFTLIKPES